MREPDVVVLGGGIVGLTVAYFAQRSGRRVRVLDDGRPSATAAAAGMLTIAAEVAVTDPSWRALALESRRGYAQFVHQLEAENGQSLGHSRVGTLLVALHRDHELFLEDLALRQRRLGLGAEWLDAGPVRAKEPALSSRVTRGLFLPDDHQIDPRRLKRALAETLRRGGGEVQQATAKVRSAGGRVQGVELDSGEFVEAAIVVVTSGAWSGESVALPLRPVKGQALRLAGAPLIRHVVRTPEVYLVPRSDGEIVVGATMEERGFDERPTAEAAFELLREALRVLPPIGELALREHNVGFRPMLRDGLPAVGEAKTRGLYVSTGHGRHGVLLAPRCAELLVRSFEGPQAELAAFSPLRFGDQA